MSKMIKIDVMIPVTLLISKENFYNWKGTKKMDCGSFLGIVTSLELYLMKPSCKI